MILGSDASVELYVETFRACELYLLKYCAYPRRAHIPLDALTGKTAAPALDNFARFQKLNIRKTFLRQI